MRTDVLGVGFDNVTLEEAADLAMAMLDEPEAHLVATPNPEIVQLARQDSAFAAVLEEAALVIPDGIGVVYAAKILGRPLKGRVPGIEFAAALMERLAERGGRLYLLGAKPGVAELAAANLRTKYSGLVICGTHDGYFSDDAAVAEEICQSGADVVFVCLGAPKQETWIAAHGGETGARVLAGLGGSLDVFAGQVKRAPEVFQKLGLEWFYRLCCQPSRIGRMAKLPLFLVTAAGERLKGK